MDSNPANSSETTKAKKPLAAAEVVVEEVEGNPGYYTSKFFLRPHYQLEGLSVREAETLARRGRKPDKPGGKRGRRKEDPVARKAAVLLSRVYGTDVKVSLKSSTSGEIRIPFRDPDDFERVTRELLGEHESADLFGAR